MAAVALETATPHAAPPEMTWKAYLEAPEIRARYEIIDGVMRMSPAPLPKHQQRLFLLARLL